MTPRVAPRPGLAVRGFARLAGRVTGTEPPGVFLTLGRQPRLFWSWLLFAGSMMPGGRIPRRETELVILRVATLSGSVYELAQHRGLARRSGVPATQVEQVTSPAFGPGAEGWDAWSPLDRLLVRVADELYAEEDLSDATWSELRACYDEPRCVELVMLVGHYRMLATALTTLRVAPDRRGAGGGAAAQVPEPKIL